MADWIPPEDNITHAQLWKRIDGNNETLQNLVTQQESHWQESVAAIVTQIQSILAEAQNYMEDKKKDIDGVLQEQSSAVQKTMENTLAHFSQRLDEFIGKVETKFNTLQTDISKKVDDANMKASTDAKITASDLKKELEQAVTNSVNQLIGKMNENRRELDIKFNMVDSKVESTAKTEVDKYFFEVINKVNFIDEDNGNFKKDITDQLVKYQSDMGLKLQQANEKLDNVLGKLKGILKEL